ncbi:hypothetical protein VKT23_008212 [Stygiomarasmius scandens]|uniref:Uncharacterized protein n=1 Tax=Marasmiellus scandens TaxID=2682957 RepID=A0ABR1JM81_9AGAR
MPERNKCEEANQMSAFLSTTTTRFLGKFGFADEEKGINIPAVPGFEDITPGSSVEVPTAVSGSASTQNAGPETPVATSSVHASSTIAAANPTDKDIAESSGTVVPSIPTDQSNSADDPSATPSGPNVPTAAEPTSNIPTATDQSTSATGSESNINLPVIDDSTPTNNYSVVNHPPKNPETTHQGSNSGPENPPESPPENPPENPPTSTAAPTTASTSAPPSTITRQSIQSIKGIEQDKLYTAAEQLGWMNLTEKELKIRMEGFKVLRKRLQTWYAKEHRKVEKGNDKLIDKLADVGGRSDPWPVRVNDVQMFMKLYWETIIKPVAAREIEQEKNAFAAWTEQHPDATKDEIKKSKPVNVAIRTRVAKRLWEEQDEEFKKEI